MKAAGDKKSALSAEPAHIVEARKRKERIGREVRRDIRRLVKGGSPEVRILGQMLECNLLALRQAASDLQTGKSRNRGRAGDVMAKIEAHSSQCWRLWDRFLMAHGQTPPGEQEPVMDVREYLAQKQAKERATLSRKRSGPEPTVGKGTARTEGARFPDSGES